MTIRHAVLAFACATLLSACDVLNDTVESNYGTLVEARADRLFERGWLPDILPPSTRDITTRNQLDLNYSTGGFSFDPSDAQSLTARLSPGAIHLAKFDDWDKTVAARKAKGLQAWSYRDGSYGWVFFCDMVRGRCEYMMH
jgi:hypothetical protein